MKTQALAMAYPKAYLMVLYGWKKQCHIEAKLAEAIYPNEHTTR